MGVGLHGSGATRAPAKNGVPEGGISAVACRRRRSIFPIQARRVRQKCPHCGKIEEAESCPLRNFSRRKAQHSRYKILQTGKTPEKIGA
jgi:hypothetical protein